LYKRLQVILVSWTN